MHMIEVEFNRYANACPALRLLSARGIEKDGLLSLPPEGRGMAQALELGELSLDGERWESAERCRIVCDGEEWLLSNHSSGIVCTLNGRRIASGETAALQIGDTLELDLLRFLVVEHPQSAGHWKRDPFVTLGIEGGGPASRVARPTGIATDAEQLFERLNDEFVSTVRDPLGSSCFTGKPGLSRQDNPWNVASSVAEHAPTLDELSVQARPYPMLCDILRAREAIDKVIGRFDAFGEADLSRWDAQPDVLRIFAPEIAHRAKARLPGLTRREHHAMSIDSAMTLGNGHLADNEDRP